MLEFFIFLYFIYLIAYGIYFKYCIKPNFEKKIIFITGGSSGIGE